LRKNGVPYNQNAVVLNICVRGSAPTFIGAVWIRSMVQEPFKRLRIHGLAEMVVEAHLLREDLVRAFVPSCHGDQNRTSIVIASA